MFYVNGKLKHIIDDFDEIIARDFDNFKTSRGSLNFTLGGGSQGY
jgi:hypothetical protein